MAPTVDYTYPAAVQRVIDADTLVLDIDLGFYVSTTVHVRLKDVDAPELDTDAGRAARQYAISLLVDTYGSRVVVQTRKVPERSFARYVATVWLPDGRSLGDLLVAAGHARPEGDS